MKQKRYKGKYTHKKRILWGRIMLLAILLSAVAAVAAISLHLAGARSTYRELSASVQANATQSPETKPVETAPPEIPALPEVASQTGPAAPTEQTVPEETEPKPLSQYLELYEKNSDFFAWLKIDDTKIDYPVMYAPDDLEKYLHRDFNGDYFYGGTPYMDVRCTPESENYLIYGHNMADGSMFRGIMQYAEKDYWKSHPVIQFDTLWTEGEYEILAAFYDRVYYSNEHCFKFYNVIDLEDREAYADAVKNFQDKSLYDTGVTPGYGTQLITLVTCAYHTENGRFVVVAAQKPDAPTAAN